MSVAINVQIVLGNGLSPEGAALEFSVVDVDTGIDDVDIDALTAVLVILILGEGAEAELLAVTDPSKALNSQSQRSL